MASQVLLSEAPFWRRQDEAIAIIETTPEGDERLLSFAELATRRDALSSHLAAHGLQPGDRVIIAGENSLEHVIALLGVMQAGGVACLMNIKLAPQDQEALARETGARFAITDQAGWDDLNAVGFNALADLPAADFSAPSLTDDALAMIMFTSGSSGLPKGVPIPHAGYGWALGQFTGLAESMAGEAGIVAAPLFHMNGQFHLLNLLSCGARVVLMTRFTATGMLDAIGRHAVKRVTGVPTMAALMAEALEAEYAANVSGVHQIGLGSAPLSRQMLSRLLAVFPNSVITNGYGTTETGPVSFSAHPDGVPTPPTALGYPMAGVELKLVGGPSPDEGVLHIRNPMTLKSYWDRPEASAARIDDEGWYITGDRMRRDTEGFFYFVGRADDMMQVGAENVFPAEVERLLEQHPAVREAVVVAVPHSVKHEAPVAFVTLAAQVDEDALKAFALEAGPAYAHPRRVFTLEGLPLASTNKIDRAALREDALRRIGGTL